MNRPVPGSLRRVELFLLSTLAFVLPILEAPKNIVLVLLLVCLLVRLAWTRPPLRMPNGIELILLLMFVASVASTVANWPIPDGNKGAKDTFVNVTICWYMYRTALTRGELYRLARWFNTGILVGLAWGVVEVLQHKRDYLEFHSAGIVTQSAIYLVIGLSMAFGIASVATRRAPGDDDPPKRSATGWWISVVIMVIALFLMASRGSIVAGLVIGIVFTAVLANVRIAAIGLVVVAAAIGLAALLPNKFDQSRLFTRTAHLDPSQKLDANDSVRVSNWRIALAEFEQTDHKLFGIGPRNFQSIRPETLHFDQPIAIQPGGLKHAHNLFLNVLAEEGILGFAALVGLFLVVTLMLARDWWRGQWFHWPWFAAFGGLAGPVIAGSFNAPFYQEHAIFAMMLFGVYFRNRLARAPARERVPAGSAPAAADRPAG